MVIEPRLHNPCGGDLALDFVNSIGRSPGRFGRERLADYAALLTWSRQAGSLPEARAGVLGRLAKEEPARAAKVLARARKLREALFETFRAESKSVEPPTEARVEALATINAELERALVHVRVERSGEGWTWSWAGEAALDAPLWPIARAAAELLVSPDRALVKECDSETCLWLFLDRTRNRRRRWCEMAGCGNRAKVRRHRRRKREGARHGGAADPGRKPGR